MAQNSLKRWFMVVFLVYLLGVLGLAASGMFATRAMLLPSIGLALSAMAPLGFFLWIMIAKPARTVAHPVGISVISGLGLAICMTASWRFGDVAENLHIFAGMVVVGWFAYLRWYSVFGVNQARQVSIGEILPELKVKTLSGETISLKSLSGRKLIIQFIRGNWCPFCMGQMEEWREYLEQVKAMNARLVIISSQPPRFSEKLVSRLESGVEFFHDPGSDAARAVGIEDTAAIPAGLGMMGYEKSSAVPTTILVNESGLVVHVVLADHYRNRPHPAALLHHF